MEEEDEKFKDSKGKQNDFHDWIKNGADENKEKRMGNG